MAYTCVFNHKKECDGCEECREGYEEEMNNDDWEHDSRMDYEWEKEVERRIYGNI